MRQITREAAAAFEAGQPFKKSNTEVVVGNDYVVMYLHGNAIAKLHGGCDLEVTLAGWGTPTTRERLNGLNGVSANQHKGEQYINGEVVDENQWVLIR